MGLGHVHPWLPKLSDLGVYAPEKYFYRLGVVLSASLMAVAAVIVYTASEETAADSVALRFGLVGPLGLAVLAVVSEKEDNPVHSGEYSVRI